MHNVGLDVWTHSNCPSITHELVSEALRFLLDRSFHPILVMSSSGSHQVGNARAPPKGSHHLHGTVGDDLIDSLRWVAPFAQVGTLVGCLRRMQQWGLTSILYEYRSYAAPTPRLSCEHFIEQWDPDLVSPPVDVPHWFEAQQQLLAAEQVEWAAPLAPTRVAHFAVAGPLASPGVTTTLCDADEKPD